MTASFLRPEAFFVIERRTRQCAVAISAKIRMIPEISTPVCASARNANRFIFRLDKEEKSLYHNCTSTVNTLRT